MMTVITLDTERLALRPPTMQDVATIQRLANDPTISDNTLAIPYPYSISDAEDFVAYTQAAWRDQSEYVFAISLKTDQTFVGMNSIRIKSQILAEAGYWIGKPYRGKGYATEALKALIGFGFEQFDINRIQAHYFTFNPASRRVQEKAGMTFEGVLRGRFKHKGRYIDAGICAITRADYAANKP